MAQSLDAAAPAARLQLSAALARWVRAHKITLALAVIALCLRLYGLTSYPFNGDEYNTIAEAKHFGLNWTSILYYVFLHQWISLGADEALLRLPSVVLDVATLFTLSGLARRLAGERAAIAMGAIAASSPFLIYHVQEARFYTLFIFATALWLLLTVRLTEQPANRRAWTAVLTSALALLFSHFFGLLAIAAQGLAVLTALDLRWARWKRAAIALLVLVGCFTIPILPPVQQAIWSFYNSVVPTTFGFEPVTVPLSAVNLFKVAMALYTFTLGYHVYPLSLGLVIPGVLLAGFLIIVGLARLARHSAWGFMPVFFAVTLLGAYFVLDPIGGRLASGISPRHVAFIWPVYMLVIAVGIASLTPRWSYATLGLLVALNIASLYPRWTQEWSYTGLLDYRAAAAFASAQAGSSTLILNDGRSAEPVAVYFPAAIPQRNFWPYLQGAPLDDLLAYDRIIVVTNDYQPARRQDADTILERLAGSYTVVAGRVEYPLFEYVLERKPAGQTGFAVDPATGQIRQPNRIYGLEFQDLRLPVTVDAAGVQLSISGALSVSSSPQQREFALPLDRAPLSSRLILVSNLVQATGLADGQQVAELRAEFADGTSQTMPLRYGAEVQDWAQVCGAASSCQTVYQWHKRIAFVGQQSYPGSWRDYQAGMHAAELAISHRSPITRLTLRYTYASGRLSIWGIAVAR